MGQWIYGRNAVSSVLEIKGQVLELYLQENINDKSLLELAKQNQLKITYVPKYQLKRMCGTDKHQGCLALVEDYHLYSLKEMIEDASKSEYPLLILLDSLKDPHNLGAILRSADAVNADGVIYAKNRSVSLNPTVAKVSVGAINSVKVCEVTNLSQAIKKLKENGYWIVSASDKDAMDYREVDYKCPIGLVIGAEGEGISKHIKDNSDFLVGLPMKGKVNSLNASVAAGILMYAIESNRYPAKMEACHGKDYNR